MPWAIEATGVTKSYGPLCVVNDVSFQVPAGICFGLLGPNGAGKSTLIRLLYGARTRENGSLKVLGKDPAIDAREIKKRLGVLPQENCLDDLLTVEENLAIFGRYHDIAAAELSNRCSELVKFLSLEAKLKAPTRSLSGGMQRRLAFARALLHAPEILILDEPTTGLDPAVRRLLWQRVSDLKKAGTTVVLTTHYMEEAEALCDQLVILDHGKVLSQGSPQNLIETFLKKESARSDANLEDVFLSLTGRELSGDA